MRPQANLETSLALRQILSVRHNERETFPSEKIKQIILAKTNTSEAAITHVLDRITKDVYLHVLDFFDHIVYGKAPTYN